MGYKILYTNEIVPLRFYTFFIFLKIVFSYLIFKYLQNLKYSLFQVFNKCIFYVFNLNIIYRDALNV